MKINWKVRAKNKLFWITLIPAVLMLVTAIAGIFGYELDFGVLQGKLIEVVEAAFSVLAILGIVADPTTAGVEDSNLAMTYEKPKEE